MGWGEERVQKKNGLNLSIGEIMVLCSRSSPSSSSCGDLKKTEKSIFFYFHQKISKTCWVRLESIEPNSEKETDYFYNKHIISLINKLID